MREPFRLEHGHVYFGAGRQPVNPAVPTLDPALRQLLKSMPKAELHCHLSGSTPIGLIREFMRENEVPAADIAKMSRLKNRYRDLDDFLATYYKVPAQVKTPEQFRRATLALIQEAAQENVRLLEIRSSILAKGGATPDQIAEAIQQGMREGMAWVQRHHGYAMNVGLIVLAQRAGTPQQSLESAQWAVELRKQPGSLIRGFDLAGSEGQHTVLKHADALRYAKAHNLPLTVHAGETESSEGISGVDSIKAALAVGAERIGHGLQVMRDPKLLRELAQKRIPVELCPWSNVQLSAVPNFQQHPIAQMLQKKLNVSLSTDNRMMSKITLTDQLAQLCANGLLPCWEQVKTLTLNGVRGAFISPFEKQKLARDFNRQFAQLENAYRTVINRFFCKPCEHPKSKNLQEFAKLA